MHRPSEGHEGVQAGAAMAFERGKDILVPYYRDLGLALGHRRHAVRSAALALRARGRPLGAGASFRTTMPAGVSDCTRSVR